MTVRKRKEPKRRNKKRGRPRLVALPVDLEPEDRPENYPSLLKYMEKTNGIEHTNYMQVRRARHLYVTKQEPVDAVAHDLGLPESIVERWIVIYGWEEERDRRLFNKWNRLNKLSQRLSPNTDERHDRIAGTIEQVIERMLQQHQDGGGLSPKDVATMASTLKTTQEIRRTVRNRQKVNKNEQTVDITIRDERVKQIGTILAAAAADDREPDVPRLENKRQLSVQFGDQKETLATDDEFDD